MIVLNVLVIIVTGVEVVRSVWKGHLKQLLKILGLEVMMMWWLNVHDTISKWWGVATNSLSLSLSLSGNDDLMTEVQILLAQVNGASRLTLPLSLSLSLSQLLMHPAIGATAEMEMEMEMT